MSQASPATQDGPRGPRMSFSEALELVHELANSNQIDAIDIAFGDEGLSAQRLWQEQALDTLHDIVVNHQDKIDALSHPETVPAWPDEVWQAKRDMNPADPANAIRICLDMAEGGVLEEDQADSPELALERERQLHALDVACDFLGLHGDTLRRSITPVPNN